MAAADYAEGKSKTPPLELQYAFDAHRWNTMPESGGLRDQPAGLVMRMTAAENVYNAVRGALKAKNFAQWADTYPAAFRIYLDVRKLRQNE